MVGDCLGALAVQTLADRELIVVDNGSSDGTRAALGTLDAATMPPLYGPSGGAALYSRGLLSDVGLFDPDFGMYYEDVDLAWRARLRGWGCAWACDARALHLGSATAGRNSPRKR